jgi:glycolate oxidase iron-sulfur subunit
MQTKLADFIRNTPRGEEADRILRSCVHCGFCNATCPTYQMLGDELDGPRGRIYLMKQMLEGCDVTRTTQLHLDRCLTCLNCETTCPSGVDYGQLLDIGRELVEARVRRPPLELLVRWLLRQTLVRAWLFTPLLRLGQSARPLLPASLRAKVPVHVPPGLRPDRRQPRKMLALEGCVQAAMTPDTNAASARVLDRLGIELIAARGAGCCGALSHHLGAPHEAQRCMRRNIDAWWPHIEGGVEAIVMTASGCGAIVRDYARLLRDFPGYAEKAARIRELTRDLSEVLAGEDLSEFRSTAPQRIAFHSPCTLQHGQKLRGVVEKILSELGHELVPVRDSHLCCGSAGTYSILQGDLSRQLLVRKLSHLQEDRPDVIATANMGCQVHLATQAAVPVVHWISLLDRNGARSAGPP